MRRDPVFLEYSTHSGWPLETGGFLFYAVFGGATYLLWSPGSTFSCGVFLLPVPHVLSSFRWIFTCFSYPSLQNLLSSPF
ncbi:hypothetical protein EV401DRAFT_1898820 [Pisolithus croceorrhizus]|nr:hypothetical protein EV401DRAFT_1898820 [Pisolithus croceorrhizus]